MLPRIMESSDIVPICAKLFQEGGLNKGTMETASTSVPRGSCFDPRPSSPCTELGQFSSSPYASGTFQAAAPVLELRVSESE